MLLKSRRLFSLTKPGPLGRHHLDADVGQRRVGRSGAAAALAPTSCGRSPVSAGQSVREATLSSCTTGPLDPGHQLDPGAAELHLVLRLR